MDQELFARFRKCAVEVLSVVRGPGRPEARFGDDLDADSLDLVELVMALEEEFDIEVPEEELEGIETVGQAYDLVAGKLALTMDGRGRRVAVTGLGVVAPCGIGVDAFWAGLLGPGITVGPIDRDRPTGIRSPWYDTPEGGPPRRPRRAVRHRRRRRGVRRRPATLGVDPARFGTIFATGVGGLHTLEEQVAVRIEKGERRVSPFLVPMMMANAAGRGDLDALRPAGPERDDLHRLRRRHPRHRQRRPADRLGSLRRGRHRRQPRRPATITSLAGFGNMTALVDVGHQPPVRRRPRRLRDGRGRGRARARGVGARRRAAAPRSSARSLGAASNADAHHITAPSPGGAGAIACMRLALDDAGLDARRHRARSTPTARRRRSTTPPRPRPCARCSATPGPPVTSIKGVTGHALGAAGALEAAAVLLSMRAPPDPADGEHQGRSTSTSTSSPATAAAWEPGPTISNNFGFGGHNGSVILAPA